MAACLRRWLADQRGSALVEVALVLPLLLLLALGVVGVGRVIQARMSVSAVAREAARVAALAQSPGEAAEQGLAAGRAVAMGYGLTNGTLTVRVDPAALERGGAVHAWASYRVSLEDLPLMGWAGADVAAEHVERVDLYRSRWRAGGSP